ncbi:hypothetical protein [Thalassomonas sp. RHCl1]|uniref:hypothetical protein n=1 Tax=Thalassomonas sp. RHCl1 TaxID=2995320 RepID=UPI00248B2E4A|nr:hypothetical protein [Thalassomonas sp. RHCl1]
MHATSGGSQTFNDPIGTYTYLTYACIPNGGGCSSAISTKVEVRAVPTPGKPSLSSSPSSVTYGESYTISWGNVSELISGGKIHLDRRLEGSSTWTNVLHATSSGSRTFNDPIGKYHYLAYACNPNGGGCSSSNSVSVVVNPVPTPGMPSISSSPSSVNNGESYTISWGNASDLISGGKIHLDRRLEGSTSWTNVLHATSSGSRTFNDPVGKYHYIAYACNPNGGDCSRSNPTSVVVNAVLTPGAVALSSSSTSVNNGASYTINWGSASNLISGGEIHLDRRLNSGSTWSKVLKTTTSGSQTFTDPIGKYTYSVYACNPGDAGCGDPNYVTVEVGPSFTVADKPGASPGTNQLTWDAFGNNVYLLKEYINNTLDNQSIVVGESGKNTVNHSLDYRLNQSGYSYEVCSEDVCLKPNSSPATYLETDMACVFFVGNYDELSSIVLSLNNEAISDCRASEQKTASVVITNDISFTGSTLDITAKGTRILAASSDIELTSANRCTYNGKSLLTVNTDDVVIHGLEFAGPYEKAINDFSNNTTLLKPELNGCSADTSSAINIKGKDNLVINNDLHHWSRAIKVINSVSSLPDYHAIIKGNYIHANNLDLYAMYRKTVNGNVMYDPGLKIPGNGSGSGMGYGIAPEAEGATVLALRNYFEDNRHDIAGGGNSQQSYFATHNIIHQTGYAATTSKNFDMHGKGDGTVDTAGKQMTVSNNIWMDMLVSRSYAGLDMPIQIRGKSDGKHSTKVENNYFHKLVVNRKELGLSPENRRDGIFHVPKNETWQMYTDPEQTVCYKDNFSYSELSGAIEKGKVRDEQNITEITQDNVCDEANAAASYITSGELTLELDVNQDRRMDKIIINENVSNIKDRYEIHFDGEAQKSLPLVCYVEANYDVAYFSGSLLDEARSSVCY